MQRAMKSITTQIYLLEEGYRVSLTSGVTQLSLKLNIFPIDQQKYEELRKPLETIKEVILALIDAIGIAFILASTIAVILFVANQYGFIRHFNNRVLNMRRGIGKESVETELKRANISSTSALVGGHVAFSIAAVLLAQFVLTIFLTPVFLTYTWMALWEYRSVIIMYKFSFHIIDSLQFRQLEYS
jgi:hypothetical protein